MNPDTLRYWVKSFKAGTLKGSISQKLSSEAQELQQLRQQIKQQAMEIEFLKKATTYFAKELK